MLGVGFGVRADAVAKLFACRALTRSECARIFAALVTAGAAVAGIGVGLYAGTVALDGGVTGADTVTVVTDLTHGTHVVALSAMHRARVGIDTRRAARLLS